LVWKTFEQKVVVRGGINTNLMWGIFGDGERRQDFLLEILMIYHERSDTKAKDIMDVYD
jgi:hypothetical protein